MIKKNPIRQEHKSIETLLEIANPYPDQVRETRQGIYVDDINLGGNLGGSMPIEIKSYATH